MKEVLCRMLCFAAVLLVAASSSAQIRVIEILADPASDWNGDGEVGYRDDEWVEVMNTGSEAVDLVHYYLRDGLGDDPHLNLFGVLPPGEAAVFYGTNAVAFQQEAGLSVSGLSLNNSGDTVEVLYQDPATDEMTVVDSYVYEDHEVLDDRAATWFVALEGWAVADALNPYTGDTEPLGSGCPPSPGEINTCIPSVAVEEYSWGRIRANYR